MGRISEVPIRFQAACVGLLLTAAPAFAARHLPAPAEAVRWLAPVAGETLTAGERLRIAWEPGPAFAALGAVEEWELFLSYDGGRSWAVRLTPHLDAARRRFEIELPTLPSDDVRFLMRIGDERVEHEVGLAGSWRIAPGRSAARYRADPTVAARGRRSERGEGARPGEPGSLLWLDGSRAGSELRWSAYGPLGPAVAGSSWRLVSLPPPLGAAPRPPGASPAKADPAPHLFVCPIAVPIAHAAAVARVLPPLLQSCRRNE